MPLPLSSFQLADLSKNQNAVKASRRPATMTINSAFAVNAVESPSNPRTPTRGVSSLAFQHQAQDSVAKRKREERKGEESMRAMPSPAGFRLSTPARGVKLENEAGIPEATRRRERERSETPLRKVSALSFGLSQVHDTASPVKRQRPLVVPDLKLVKKEERLATTERALNSMTSLPLPAPKIRETIEDAGLLERSEVDEWVTPSKKGGIGRRTGKPPLSYLLAKALMPYNASLNLFYQSQSSILRHTPLKTHILNAALHLRLQPCPPGSTIFHATSLDGSKVYQLLLQPLPRGCVQSGVDPGVVRVREEQVYEIGLWSGWGILDDVLVCSRYLIVCV